MPFTEEQFFQVSPPIMRPSHRCLPSLTSSALHARSTILAVSDLHVAFMAILALMWFVNGVGYHWSFFTSVDPAARTFGAVFVVKRCYSLRLTCRTHLPIGAQGRCSHGRRVSHSPLRDPCSIRCSVAFRSRLPGVPVFGIAPCPAAIFTIGIPATAPLARCALFIPALWAIIGGSAALPLNRPARFRSSRRILVALGFAAANWFRAGVARHLANAKLPQ